MNDAWQQLLDLPPAAATAESWLVPLADYAVLEIAGPDAARFLQGQLTCHLDAIDGQQGAPGAQCSLKGRVLSSFLLGLREPARYWLRLSRDLLEPTAALLGKYIVFSKATLTPHPELVVLGLVGPGAAALLGEAAPPAGHRHATAAALDGLVWQRDAAGTRFECWLPPAQAVALAARATAAGIGRADAARWQLLDIAAGECDVTAANADQFLPQMLNYDAVGAVRFDKGCYTGQEIVARAHYRGQVKRRLGRFADAGEPPVAGTPVTDADGREVGSVVLAAGTGGGCELLAVTSLGATAPLRTGMHDLRALPLPYAISDGNR